MSTLYGSPESNSASKGARKLLVEAHRRWRPLARRMLRGSKKGPNNNEQVRIAALMQAAIIVINYFTWPAATILAD